MDTLIRIGLVQPAMDTYSLIAYGAIMMALAAVALLMPGLRAVWQEIE